MTITEMFQQGMIFHLIGMGILFILMVIMISAIGGWKNAQKEAGGASSLSKSNKSTHSGLEVTAAITAAVREYKKNS